MEGVGRGGKRRASGLASRAVTPKLRALALVALGLSLASPPRADDAGFASALDRLVRAPALKGARVGVVVEELGSGRRLLEHEADAALVPASNQKLLVAAASLAHWGPAHRFETPILIEGELADGVLDGALWVVGRGDPSLVSESLWKLAEEVRLRGIREANGDLLVFVDDDNLIDPDYLETAARVADEKPFLGSWSGQCRPEFEEVPPDWTRRYWGNLVIREFDRDVWSNLPLLPETMPCGAGLCVRRNVARHYVRLHETGERAFQFDRAGDALLSGGDNDLAACACDLGLGVGLIATLKLTHLIPRERLTEAYLVRLTEGIHFSSTLLDAARGVPPRPRDLLGSLADVLRILRQKAPHRRILRAAFRGRNRATRLILAKPGSTVSDRE